MERSVFGTRSAAWIAALAALASGLAACRSEPTARRNPQPSGRGAGAIEGAKAGYGALAPAGLSPTVCSDDLRKGGLPIGDAPRRGSADPLVAVVEFANLDCVECAAAAGKVEAVLEAYPDDVALFYVNVQGTPNAVQPGKPMPVQGWRLAAQASMAAARNGKFWDFVKLATATPGKLAQPDLESYAQQAGMDVSVFRGQMNSRDTTAAVDAGAALAAELGVRGPLPVFWVNGEIIPADQVDAKLREVVDEKVRAARDLLAAPRSRCELLARFVSTRQMEGARPQLQAPQRPQRPQEDPNVVYKVPVGDSPVKGAREPLVTLIEFSDFQCPYCSKAATTVHALLEAYPNDVAVVFKQRPLDFHQFAQLAAEASLAAEDQGKFWEYHDKVFANQQALDRPSLERYAEEVGLDMARFRRALDEHAFQGAVQADIRLAQQFNVTGTPTFIMNGRKTPNMPIEQFRARIDQEIAKVKALVDAGTPRAQVYEKLIANGSDRAVFLPMPPGDQGQAGPPPPPPGPPPLPGEVKDVKVEPWNPSRGSADAKVTLVVFCEYMCPFCMKVQPILKQLEAAYGDRVRVVFRSFIVHPPAEPHALAALAAAKQGKFEALHDLFFQPGNFQQVNDRAGIERLAEQAGLDMARFRADMDSPEIRQQLEADKAEAARLGVGGTPSTFIAGRIMVGARPPSHWGSWIDQLLGITTPTIPASADPAPQGGGGGCGGAPAPAPQPAAVLQPVPAPAPAAIAARPTPPAANRVPAAAPANPRPPRPAREDVEPPAPRPRRPATPPPPPEENPY